MKLKILSICSVISLIYGDAFCASVKNAVKNYEAKIQSQNKNQSINGNYKKARKISKVMKRVKEIEGQNKEEISSYSKRQRKVMNDKEDNFLKERAIQTSSISDSVSEEMNMERVENSSADLKKFAESINTRFSESQKMLDKFEQKISDLSESLNGSDSADDQFNKADSLRREMAVAGDKIDAQIDDLNQAQQEIEDLKISEKLDQLNNYRIKISNMRLDVSRKMNQVRTNQRKQSRQQSNEEKKVESQKMASIDWQSIEKYNETLSLFTQAVRNYKLRFTTIQKYGKQCFEDQDGRALFDPNQNMASSLKGLCKQIYDVRFPEAVKVWSDIKKMNEKDENYVATVELLRSKIKALGRNVSSLIKQGRKVTNSSQQNDGN